jgi:hypothetical protein
VTALRVLGWAVLYAGLVAAAVIAARGSLPFVYQGF